MNGGVICGSGFAPEHSLNEPASATVPIRIGSRTVRICSARNLALRAWSAIARPTASLIFDRS